MTYVADGSFHVASRPRTSTLQQHVFCFGMSIAALSQAVFNLAPGFFGDLLEVGFFVAALVLVLMLAFSRSQNFLSMTGLLALLFFITIMTVTADYSRNTLFLLRIILSVVLLSLLSLGKIRGLSNRQIGIIRTAVIFAAIFAIAQAFLLDPIAIGGKERLAVFAGGSEGLHPSAYSAMAMMVALFALGKPTGYIKRILYFCTILGLFLTVVFFEVRTVWLLGLTYLALTWIARLKPRLRKLLIALCILCAPIFIIMLVLFLSVVDPVWLGDFSSGRTIVYGERLAIIANRDLIQFLFGTGAGTDFFSGGTVWRYEAKNSHNDILTLTIESGILGLLSVIVIAVAGLFRIDTKAVPLFLAFLSTSLISNGLILRPSSGGLYIFTILLISSLSKANAREAAGARL